ncbi:MAG TPA: hypothetical protein PKZ92_02835 [Candidatus Woesebacteria bacterium]|jgi:hypothetical protein|nr:LytR C-terminal domain-containing protein [Candidatus Shapirobacteria bacterium]HOR02171.1 hypothetical protein [Candidatus Woesebacteria bacterium]
MKRGNKKIYLGVAILVGLGLVVMLAWSRTREEKGRDLRLGVIADDGIGVVTISKDRQMISQMKIKGDTQAWIPGGLGWYRAEAVKKILLQEKKTGWGRNIFIYGLGFYPDKVVWVDKIEDWKSRYWWQMLRNNNLLNKNEDLVGNIDENEIYLDQVMLRDFAETKVVEAEVKLSVINTSLANGLAGFITKRLERLGFSVVSVSTEEGGENECKILYGEKVAGSYPLKVLTEIFDCQVSKGDSLNENEIEIYLTDSFSTMIDYPSYKQ